jgi:hypothetical protein
MSTDLTIQTAPRISAAQFARVLTRAHSPAAPDAAALYPIPIERGLDPAVALAFFGHESTYGTAGVAVRSRNWGNLRRGARATYHADGFAYYADWRSSLADWTDRIADTYIRDWQLTTVRAVLERYAPSSDGNAPARYAAAVADLVAHWQAEEAQTTRGSALDALTLLDLTDQIAAIPLVRGHQILAPREREQYLTFHYSAVIYTDRSRAAELARIISEARFQIEKNWETRPGRPPIYGDGLMYDFVVLSDGTIVRTRKRGVRLWHCNNTIGNNGSWSIHWMLGPGQDLTPAQRASSFALADALCADGDIPRHNVVAHCEWPLEKGEPVRTDHYHLLPGQSTCPGATLFPHVVAYRASQDGPAALALRFHVTVPTANVRQGPGTTYPIAGTMHRGDELIADKVLDGQAVGDDRRWAHRADGLGFVHLSVLEAA